MADLVAACGADRPVAVARELTKLHEEVWRGTLGEAVDVAVAAVRRGGSRCSWSAAPRRRREPAERGRASTAALQARLAAGADRQAAVAEVAGALGVPERQVYQVAVAYAAGPGTR